LKTKDREKSAKSEKGEKDKLPKTAEKADKSRLGSKLSVVDKPERSKSGGPSAKGRRMSKMERPGGDLSPKSKKMFTYFSIWLQTIIIGRPPTVLLLSFVPGPSCSKVG